LIFCISSVSYWMSSFPSWKAWNEYVLHDVILLSEFHSNKILILCEIKKRHEVTRVWTFFLLFRSKQIIFFPLLSAFRVCHISHYSFDNFPSFFLFNNLTPERKQKKCTSKTLTRIHLIVKEFSIWGKILWHIEKASIMLGPPREFNFAFDIERRGRKMQNSCSMLNLPSFSLHLCVLYERGKRKIGNPCTCEDFLLLLHFTFFLYSMNIFREEMKGVLLLT
jgi:hypothetical protein